jgi:short-subunit dehydrogenase
MDGVPGSHHLAHVAKRETFFRESGAPEMNAKTFREKYGPWAVVAGASEGLGAAFAEECARRGLNVVLVARSIDKLNSVRQVLEKKYKTENRVLAMDLSEPDAAEQLDIKTKDLDAGLLIYNAALSLIGPYMSFSPGQHRATVATNCQTPALCAHLFGRRFTSRGRGGILLMSSMAGFQGSATISHYAATKAYLMVLAEGLSREYAAYNIDVSACCAGATTTPGYLKAGNSAKKSLFVMEPHSVARLALDKINRGGIFIPGLFNKIGAFVLQRVFPRRLAVSILSHATRFMSTPREKQ